MSEKMEAVVKVEGKEGGTEIQEVPVPKVGVNDVKIQVDVASICGTDVHIYEWDPWAAGRIKPPLIYGHEFCGHVVEVGSNVDYVKEGEYVSGECHIACGHCFNCRTGLAHVCQNTKIFGVDVPGIFAKYAVIPAMNAWKNDEDLRPEFASIQDPLGNAVHTVFATDCVTKNVAVMGCGPIGLMAVAVLKHIGAAQVFAVGRRNEYRIDLAKKMGADFTFKAGDDVKGTIMKETDGRGVDAVLEFSGNVNAIKQGFTFLKKGGDMVLLGLYGKNLDLELNNELVFRYARLIGINGRLMWDTWYQMKGLFKSGLDLDAVITHRYTLSQFEEGMATMRGGKSGKVTLDVK